MAQVTHLCQRCALLDILNISVYQMPDGMGGDWACSVMGFMSDGFKSRQDAEQWAINRHFREIQALGYKPTNYKIIQEVIK